MNGTSNENGTRNVYATKENTEEVQDKDATTSKKKRYDVIQSLLTLVKDEVGLMGVGCIALIVSTMCNSMVPKAIAMVIDGSNKSHQSDKMKLPLITVLAGGAASFIRTLCLNLASHNMEHQLQRSLFRSLIRSTDQPQPTSKSLLLLNNDVPCTAKMLTNSCTNAMRNLSSILYSSYNMFQTDATLFCASFSLVPLIGATATLFSKRIKALERRETQLQHDLNDFCEERLNLKSTVQFYNRQTHEIQNFEKHLEEDRPNSRALSLTRASFMATMFLSSTATVLAVVSYGASRVRSQKLTPGSLTSFATYSFLLGLGSSGFIKACSEVSSGLAAAKRLFTLIHSSHEHDTPAPAATLVPPIQNVTSISFHNVSYTYPSSTKPVLHQINFSIQKGQIIAIVGLNGAGKSTIVSLLSGLIQPNPGEITLSYQQPNHKTHTTIPLSNLDRPTQRNCIGLIPQTPALFNLSIPQNILYSKPHATQPQLQHAMNLSTAHTFSQPYLNRPIGKNGASLSGGQRQKVALARTLLQNPKFLLILDEPMNNLDKDGEDVLLEDILLNSRKNASEKSGPAMLIVTHNPKCLKYVDRIVVLEEGRVAAQGTLRELNEMGALDNVISSFQ